MQQTADADLACNPVQDGRGLKELTVFDAHEMASKFNLPAGFVTRAWKLFKRYDSQDCGLLSIWEYQLLLWSMLREVYSSARDVPRELFERLGENEVDFSEFLTWITRNSFNEKLLLTPGQRKIRNIARAYQKPVPEVEAIKHKFDRFDVNGNGQIDFHEFVKLLDLLLGSNDMTALPESRVRSFWRELCEDGTGEVDFSEFIPWYITYFDVSCQEGSSPLEEFYRNIRPVPFVIRTN